MRVIPIPSQFDKIRTDIVIVVKASPLDVAMAVFILLLSDACDTPNRDVLSCRTSRLPGGLHACGA